MADCEDCTRTAIDRPEQLAATEPVSSETLPDQPPQQSTLREELETLAALLNQLAAQTRRTLAAGALHLGPLSTGSGLELVLEGMLGSVQLHSKHLANKRRELSDNRAHLVDQLRDLAQKAAIRNDSQESAWLAALAHHLPEQLPEVRHG